MMKLLLKLLNVICRGETTVLTSPSGQVRLFICNGWCGSWVVETENYHIASWPFSRESPEKALDALAKVLRDDQNHEAAFEVEKLLVQIEDAFGTG